MLHAGLVLAHYVSSSIVGTAKELKELNHGLPKKLNCFYLLSWVGCLGVDQLGFEMSCRLLFFFFCSLYGYGLVIGFDL